MPEPEACTGRERPIERTSTAAYYAWQMSSLTIPVAGADNPALLHALTDNATLRTLRRLTRTPEIVSNITAVATRLGIRTDDEEVTGPASLLLTRNRVSAVGGWTDSRLNAGRIEAALLSGLQAANALLGPGRRYRDPRFLFTLSAVDRLGVVRPADGLPLLVQLEERSRNGSCPRSGIDPRRIVKS